MQRLHIKVSSPRIVMFQILRGMGKGVKVAVLFALIGLVCWGGWKGVQHLFLGNEKYLLQEIDLQTNGYLDHGRVVEVADIDLKESIFVIDVDKVRMRLNDLPEVITCKVERRLPGTLRILITERVPAVWIECAALGFPGRCDGGVLADGSGITFPCEGSLWETARDLPVIEVKRFSGAKPARSEDFCHGSKMKHPEVIRALQLVKAFEDSNVRAEWLPERIVLLNDYSMEAVCNDGSRAVFGMYEHGRQLADFVTIREHTLKTGREIRHINLIPSKNIPVKFAGGAVLVKPKLQPAPIDPDEREIESILDQN